MSRLYQYKEENVGFVSNLTSVCVSYFNFFLALNDAANLHFGCDISLCFLVLGELYVLFLSSALYF